MSALDTTLQKLLIKQDLSSEEAHSVIEEVMTGTFSHIKFSAWLTAMRMKGETAEELAGCASCMNAHCIKVHCMAPDAVDTCGTGGDGAGTFNISTTAAFVAAGAGVKVAKHGNKAVSGNTGSADILSALDININLSVQELEHCLNNIGIAFLFAPNLHPSMKNVMPVRKELGMKTIFNILGPLCNPAGVRRAVIGVYDKNLCGVMAKAALLLKKERIMIVHGNDGLDELTTTTNTHICELRNGEIHEYEFNPFQYGIPKSKPTDLLGKDPIHNAGIFKEILSGRMEGAMRDIVILNSAAAIMVSGKTTEWNEALTAAEKSITSGEALSKFKALVVYSKK